MARVCLVVAFESAIILFTHACEVSEVRFVRPIESTVVVGPFETVVPACLHDRVSSPNREETSAKGSLHPGLSTLFFHKELLSKLTHAQKDSDLVPLAHPSPMRGLLKQPCSSIHSKR
eukprot:scaffold509_cov315-Pavlova_lutheri.AAC.1